MNEPRIKICIITTAYPRWTGDERAPFIHEAARALKEAGHDVRVLAIHRPGTRAHEYLDGVEIFRTRYLPEKWEILQEEGGGLPVIWKKKPLARLALLPFIICQSLMLVRHAAGCDLIHANWTLSGGIAWLTRFIHRRPFVVMVHGSDIYIGTKTGWIRKMTRILLDQAAAVIAISQDLAGQLRILGVPESKISIIPEVIDTDNFLNVEQERENTILFIGSLIPRKGCIYLLQAFGKIARELPDYRLCLVGEGADEAELRQLASDLQIGERVSFLGVKPRAEIASLMQRARLFVLPSLEEGLGVVLIEAIASGTPCVASAVGGIPDVITPDVGVLVPPGDAGALASAILDVLKDPGRWQALSSAAKGRAREVFSRETLARKFARVYLRVLGRS